MEEIEKFKGNIDDLAQEIIDRYVSFTGLPVPKSYVRPPIDYILQETIQKVGRKPMYTLIRIFLNNTQQDLEQTPLSSDAKASIKAYLRNFEAFLASTKASFDEVAFDLVDEEWLALKRSLASDPAAGSILTTMQKCMEMLYEREYDFIICGDYSYNQQKIYLYETNIIKRLTEDEKYALIPAEQALECMLAHELFHSLHFMSLHDACLENGLTMLKLFNPENISSSARNTIIRKRKTVIESLAKYFEWSYARDKGYDAYANYEKNNFIGKRKHYPSWSYAGAKGLIDSNNDTAFNEALKASLNIVNSRGFIDAYDIIDKANNQ